MRLTRILLVTATLALIGACNEATPPDQPQNDITGQVVDAQGHPVAGAEVILQYYTSPPLPWQQNRPQTLISFTMLEAGHVSVWISDYCDGEVLRQLVDGVIQAGGYAIPWDGLDDEGRFVPDSVYWFHVETDIGLETRSLMYLRPGYDNIAPDTLLASLAITDAQGRFVLAQSCLPFGYVTPTEDGLDDHINTFTITRDVRVWAFSASTGARGVSPVVTVDPDTGADVTVTLNP
ncbi:MAG: hypothetical protein Q7W56_00815 [Candidatus Latescibacteria bacterium]|nr:hypothetical protein [Candidatus Latescibacterota bacterium]